MLYGKYEFRVQLNCVAVRPVITFIFCGAALRDTMPIQSAPLRPASGHEAPARWRCVSAHDGRANHVAFVDTATRRVTDYCSGRRLYLGVVLSPNEERLYVANGPSDDISVIDMSTCRDLRAVIAGRGSGGVVVDI